MNPAVCLALLILGKTSGTEFIAAVGGEFLGAFLGAVLVWLHFLPHFKTVPAPYSSSPDSLLLKAGDQLSPTALGIASYNPREEDVAARRRGLGDIKNSLDDIKYYLKNTFHVEEPVETHAALVQVALGRDEVKDGGEAALQRLRRRSVQVCDLHRRLKDIDIDEFKSMLLSPEWQNNTRQSQQQQQGLSSVSNHHQSNQNVGGGLMHAASTGDLLNGSPKTAATTTTPNGVGGSNTSNSAALDMRRHQRLDKLYDASVIADQNAKLSIFATRPAIYTPIFNFLTEFMCTTTLIYGALMIYARRDQLYGPERLAYRAEEGIWIGFFVFLCVLGLGGPTGIAANPARDFSPRLAHFLLPIPGKGSSEFYYSWVPFFAPFLGSCAAAGLYAATQLLNDSNVPSNQTFPGVAV